MMIKKLTIIFLLLCSPVYGATQQVLIQGINDALNVSTTEYAPLYGTGNQSFWNTDETVLKAIFPASGELKDLRVKLEGAPGSGGDAYKFSVRVNEAEPASTLTCTITDGATTCNDTSNSVTISAGDYVSLENNPAVTPTATIASWSATWNPTTADETILVGGGGNNTLLADNNTRYLAVTGGTADDDVEFDRTFIAPTGGTFKNFYAGIETVPGGTATQVFTFRDSASAESIAITFTAAQNGVRSNTSDTVTATAGEKFVVVRTATNTPDETTFDVSIVFVPTTSGEWIITNPTDNPLHDNNTEYNSIMFADGSWNGTETTIDQLAQTGSFASDMIIKNMYVELELDPGTSSQSFTWTLRANAGDATAALAITLDGDDGLTGNASATVTISDDDLMTIESVPASTPTSGSMLFSFTGFIEPSASTRRVNVN